MLDKIIKHFETMEKFHDVYCIPSIPIVDQDIYKNIIVPNLIRCGAIPKKDLIIGKTYLGECRNAKQYGMEMFSLIKEQNLGIHIKKK